MPNLPLCHWSSQLFDLRASLSTDVPVLLLNQPNRSEKMSKCVLRKSGSVTHYHVARATFYYSKPHFDVTCDQVLKRRTATWNLFVKYETILGEPGAASRDDRMLLVKVYYKIPTSCPWVVVDGTRLNGR